MPITQFTTSQLGPGSVTKDDVNITTTGKALITRIINGGGFTMSGTGVDTGTGDVTLTSTLNTITGAGNTTSNALKLVNGATVISTWEQINGVSSITLLGGESIYGSKLDGNGDAWIDRLNLYDGANSVFYAKIEYADAAFYFHRSYDTVNFSIDTFSLTASRVYGVPDANGTIALQEWVSAQGYSTIPSQTGNSGKFLTTNGTTLSWATVTGGSGSVGTLQQVTDAGASTTNILTLSNTLTALYPGNGTGETILGSTYTLNANVSNYGQLFKGFIFKTNVINPNNVPPNGYTVYPLFVEGNIGLTGNIAAGQIVGNGNGFNNYDENYGIVSNGRLSIGSSNYGHGTAGAIMVNIASLTNINNVIEYSDGTFYLGKEGTITTGGNFLGGANTKVRLNTIDQGNYKLQVGGNIWANGRIYVDGTSDITDANRIYGKFGTGNVALIVSDNVNASFRVGFSSGNVNLGSLNNQAINLGGYDNATNAYTKWIGLDANGTTINNTSLTVNNNTGNFADGVIKLNSDNTVGTGIQLNNTSTGGKKYIWLSTGATAGLGAGYMGLFSYQDNRYAFGFNYTALNTQVVRGNNTVGTGINIISDEVNGGNYLLFTSGTTASAGQGGFGLFNNITGNYNWFVNPNGEFLINGHDDAGDYKLQVNGNTYVSGGITIASLAGTGTRMLVADTTGAISTQAIPSGGSGGTTSPAGANRQVQFNDNGVFGASANMIFQADNYLNLTNARLYINADATTTSNGVPLSVNFNSSNQNTPGVVVNNFGTQTAMNFNFSNTTKGKIRLDSDGNMVFASAGTLYFGYQDIVDNVSMRFGGSTERMFIDGATGRVRINTTDQGDYKLQVGGDSWFGGNVNLKGNSVLVVQPSGNQADLGLFESYSTGYVNVLISNTEATYGGASLRFKTAGTNRWNLMVSNQIGGTYKDLLFYNEQNGTSTPLIISGTTGTITLSSLAGSGTRMMVADSTGVVSTQTIPSGGGGGITRSILPVAATGNIAAVASTDYVYLATGTITLTLPTAATNTNRYTIKNKGTGITTVNTTSSQTIDGSLTITLRANQSVDIISDGTNWQII